MILNRTSSSISGPLPFVCEACPMFMLNGAGYMTQHLAGGSPSSQDVFFCSLDVLLLRYLGGRKFFAFSDEVLFYQNIFFNSPKRLVSMNLILVSTCKSFNGGLFRVLKDETRSVSGHRLRRCPRWWRLTLGLSSLLATGASSCLVIF